jgi:glutamyl-tRNA synthetase
MMILRNDDLDSGRVRSEFVAAMLEDMRWLGLTWSEGPNVGGPHAPYSQSERLPLYRDAFARLKSSGLIYPCSCTRKDVLVALSAPHGIDEEPVYPGTCRTNGGTNSVAVNWRFRVSDGERLSFVDGHFGEQSATAGVDFGDFLVWRKDELPGYQLACVVDDVMMGITEVVRGADLITSTFRQLLLFRALSYAPPAFYHCPLILDDAGKRLAKRDSSTTIRGLREAGVTAAEIVGAG